MKKTDSRRESFLQIVSGLFTEVSTQERELVENLLSNQLVSSLWDRSNDGLFLSNKDGVILTVNPAMCVILKATKEELVGKRVWFGWEENEQAGPSPGSPGLALLRRWDGHSELQVLPLASGSALHFELSGFFLRTGLGQLLLTRCHVITGMN